MDPLSPKPLYGEGQMQFGISYISSVFKKHGHQTKLIVLNSALGKKNKEIYINYLKKYRPKLICFTAVSTEYKFIANIAKFVKHLYPDIYLLIGGIHVTLNPNEAHLKYFDAMCIGEGEMAALELASQLQKGLEPSKISGLWVKHGSKVEKKSPAPLLQDLDALPFPDRQMWNEWIGKECTLPVILISRGCPFNCSYCCNNKLRNITSGAYVRKRSPDNIIKELKELEATLSPDRTNYWSLPSNRTVFLESETIDVDRKWTIELCLALEKLNATLKKPMFYGTNLRITPNKNCEELFFYLKKANFSFINIGLESGSERIRRQILKRNYSNQDVINAVMLAKKYGLKAALFNMIGIPGETLNDFKKTIEVNRQCQPDWHNTSIFFPYPGTGLYSLCKNKGLLKNTRLNKTIERKQAAFELPGFNKKQIELAWRFFSFFVYKGLSPGLLHHKNINLIKHINTAILKQRAPWQITAEKTSQIY